MTDESTKLINLNNEKSRLEKEIDVLKIRYNDQLHAFEKLGREFKEKQRVDIDNINRQLVENKARELKLQKTQSEVNALKAQIEEQAENQKNLLLKKEVELDRLTTEVKAQREELAARLAKIKQEDAPDGKRNSKVKQ